MNDLWRIPLGIQPPGKDPTSVDEMRQAIDRAARDSSLIRNSLDTAQWHGMSGEDKYAMLAYWALRELERYYRLNMHWLMTQPSPQMLIPKPPEP